MTAMMGAVVYARVSTKEQVSNLSLATQEKQCRDYCSRNGYTVLEVFVDAGESAKTVDRPEFQKMLEFCRQHRGRVAAVVVYSVSRFSRNQIDHVTVRALLSRYGVTVRSVTEGIDDSPQGKLIEGMTSVIAEYENNMKGQRSRAGMTEALQNGRWTFVPPIGYLRTGSRSLSTLVPDPARAPLIAEAFRLYGGGAYTKKDVLAIVTASGLRSRSGKKLTLQTFDRLLRNQIYAGRLRVDVWRVDEAASFPSLVSAHEFEAVQAVLTGRRVTQPKHLRNHPDFPLRHFTRCGECGRPLTASWSKGRTRHYGYYRCPGCKGVKVPHDKLHEEFRGFVEAFQPKAEYARLFRAVVEDVWKEKQRDAVLQSRQLERRIDVLRQRRARYVDAVADGRLREEEVRDRLDEVSEELAEARLALTEAHVEEIDVEAVLNFAEHMLTNVARLWTEAPAATKERLQAAVFPKGVRYSASGFGTDATCMMFSQLPGIQPAESRLASPTRFELVLPP